MSLARDSRCDAGGAAADRNNRHDRRAAQAYSMSGNAGRPVVPGGMLVVAESGGTKS